MLGFFLKTAGLFAIVNFGYNFGYQKGRHDLDMETMKARMEAAFACHESGGVSLRDSVGLHRECK